MTQSTALSNFSWREKPPRVMWLLNHGTARKFEIAMLKRLGIREIFLPKIIPDDPGFRSASIDHSEDAHLSIPKEDLEILNNVNWYEGASPQAWKIANTHFDVLFFILHEPGLLENLAKNFNGVVLWRAYGLDRTLSYSKILDIFLHGRGRNYIEKLGDRFFFAAAYEHLHTIEASYIAKRNLFLPLGLSDVDVSQHWTGNDQRILFVCPDIGFNPYYRQIYKDFRQSLGDMPHVIAGNQPLPVRDANVTGYQSAEEYARNMRDLRVMFYHSQEPNHVHYHPFEAIRAGMPLLFMAGGMLERIAKQKLPGQCKNIKDARNKLNRILEGDSDLIEKIRHSQIVLLDAMKAERFVDCWQQSLSRIEASLTSRSFEKKGRSSLKKIAVIIPAPYRGGTLRGAKLLAAALQMGSQQASEPCAIVLAHLDDPECYPEREFHDLPEGIERRPFKWQTLPLQQARRAACYSNSYKHLDEDYYLAPDDGIQQFMDCDFWLLVSDRVSHPLLPVRPYAVMIYDYLQRFTPFLSASQNNIFFKIAREAEKVLVTTLFTLDDAIQFAGIDASKAQRLPMVAPHFSIPRSREKKLNYFIWTTNLAPHKNHQRAMEALRLYYTKYKGSLDCKITGVGVDTLFKSPEPTLKHLADIFGDNPLLRDKIHACGELPDDSYVGVLKNAQFLWHPATVDNGTFSVVEAAHAGTPSLSSDYPPMREIDDQFQLNLQWMDSFDPDDMARALKKMEINAEALSVKLPSQDFLQTQSVEHVARTYWDAIASCL